MQAFKKITLTVALVALLGNVPAAYARPDWARFEQTLLEGHKVVNVLDDFFLFWEQAKGKSPRRQRRLWQRMVESKHQDYFDRAVYRDASEEERRFLLDMFLARVPDQIDQLRDLNLRIKDIVVETLAHFKLRFQDYRQRTDIYIGLSLYRFDGSVRPVANAEGLPDTLCLGAEMLAAYPVEQLQVAVAHEFFHLYHFGYLFADPDRSELRTPHLPLIVEGMAVAGSEALFPYRPQTLYLHFSDEELARQQQELVGNCQQFLELIRDDAPPERYEQWFTNASLEELPPRGGYLLGYEVTKRLLAGLSLEEMVRMTPAQLREHVEEQLYVMSADNIFLLSELSIED